MPDDVGGKPFPDGEEPDEHHHGSHGRADEEFASVVFDEEFVRAAPVHEPSAVERMLAAAEARAEAEAARSGPGFGAEGDELDGLGPRGRRHGREPDDYDGYADYGEYDDGEYGDYPPHDPYGPYGGALRPYRSSTRWHRPVAWVLAVVMGIGLVALAFSAVYRGSAGRTQNPSPAPTSSGVDAPATGGTDGGVGTVRPGLPSAPSAEAPRPSFSAVPRPH
ncbi:hypothetical protein [Streptomyces sp. NPDC058773]|uniref:SCO2584 family spore wall biosynthesis protein n=1 Tax=Streptomyces sp. NPDC058773 TaxID=3346632 RepID=UPI0036C69F0C